MERSHPLRNDLHQWVTHAPKPKENPTHGFTRQAGTVLHVTSLPGDGPIGDLDGAHAFVDWLASTGLSVWQILPTSPPGYGASPYSSWSSFSGNPWLIGLQELVHAGLLTPTNPGRAICGRRILTKSSSGSSLSWNRPLLHSSPKQTIRGGQSTKRSALKPTGSTTPRCSGH